MNADNGPASGSRMIPSIGSKYMAQLRHKGDGIKYNIACRDANTHIRVMVLEDKSVLNDVFSRIDCSILKTNVIFYTTINKFQSRRIPIQLPKTIINKRMSGEVYILAMPLVT